MDRPPATAYLICATPRSGSTLLCEMLRATGVAGRPLEHFEILRHSGLPRQPREYLTGLRDRAVLDLLPPLATAALPSMEPPERWAARIRRAGRSANGVWGGKLMWGHVEDLLARARRLDGLRSDAGLAEALGALLEDVRFVLVTRADKVAQAVSLWRALQTQRWRAEEPAERDDDAAYRFTAIDHLVAQLERDEDAWRRWFRARRLRPLRIGYEELSTDPCGTVAQVLRFLGLPADEVPVPPLRHQRDARSRAWARRYWLERRAVA